MLFCVCVFSFSLFFVAKVSLVNHLQSALVFLMFEGDFYCFCSFVALYLKRRIHEIFGHERYKIMIFTFGFYIRKRLDLLLFIYQDGGFIYFLNMKRREMSYPEYHKCFVSVVNIVFCRR